MIGWFWSKPYLLLSFTALFWAGNSIVGRATHDIMPPVALAFWRWTLALVFLLPFAWPHLKRDISKLKMSLSWVLLLGALGIGTFNTLLYTGLQTTTAVNGLLLQSMQPALILMLGAIVFGERVRLVQILGIALSITGALMIILRGDLTALVALEFNPGDLVIIAAVIVWSFYSVLLRKRPVVHPLSFLAATFAVGVVVMPTGPQKTNSLLPSGLPSGSRMAVDSFPKLIIPIIIRTVRLVRNDRSSGARISLNPAL